MNEKDFKAFKLGISNYIDKLTEYQLVELEAFFNWYIHLKYTKGKDIKVEPIAKPNTVKFCKCKAKDFKTKQ